ncbi:hypothetical protein SynA15127_02019 [Synechococcus sp. A15-127]|nr:hypothetical protein SynA15127_02019 [Synechococcus sp. A15-127]
MQINSSYSSKSCLDYPPSTGQGMPRSPLTLKSLSPESSSCRDCSGTLDFQSDLDDLYRRTSHSLAILLSTAKQICSTLTNGLIPYKHPENQRPKFQSK